MKSIYSLLLVLSSVHGFSSVLRNAFRSNSMAVAENPSSCLRMTSSSDTDEKAAKLVTGEELEMMLQEWDTPLVVDAYATWCGPCLLMAPEFEAAAKEFEGKVRFVKLDTDKDPEISTRLNIMGLPTLLFLSGKTDEEGGDQSVGVLRDRIEGALRKESIVGICNYYFFGGEMPTEIS